MTPAVEISVTPAVEISVTPAVERPETPAVERPETPVVESSSSDDDLFERSFADAREETAEIALSERNLNT